MHLGSAFANFPLTRRAYWFFFLFFYFHSAAASVCTPKICLTMIVRNESAIIERCLDSAYPVIDCLSVCDTGSTDQTVEIIEKYMETHKLPGKVHRHTWKNFGYNRTASAEAAQQTLQELGYPLESSYLLLLDADMKLEILDGFDKRVLSCDNYNLIQKNGELSYANTRLIKASLPWKCIGVTHEYWGCSEAKSYDICHTLKIDDKNDGGCKADKFERDLSLLQQGLMDEPNNPRYMFYLAQTYHCLGQLRNSNLWYKKRIDAGGWLEEVWYSKYSIGKNYEAMGDWPKAQEAYLEAYSYNPARAEPLYHIAKHHRLNGNPFLAYLFAKEGLTIPYPKHQLLFINDTVYQYGFDEELSIVSYYTPHKQAGWKAINRLLINPYVPEFAKNQAYCNSLFYVKPLRCEKITPLAIDLPSLSSDSNKTYALSSPSIIKEDDGYLVNFRTVNYRIGSCGEYTTMDEDGIVRTRNYLVHYDLNFKPLFQKEIVESFPRPVDPEIRKITGLEDVRLFKWNGKLWFVCSTFDTSLEQSVQISLGELGDPLKEESGEKTIPLLALQPISGSLKSLCEKNWLPFVQGDRLDFIYSYDPFKIYTLNATRDGVEELSSYEPNRDFSNFRGSAAPIPFKEGYLLLVHEVVFANKRSYLHRFVYLNKDLKVTKLSEPFYFKQLGVEYCLGMTVDHSGKKLILPFSVKDSSAYFAWIDLDIVDFLLQSIEHCR